MLPDDRGAFEAHRHRGGCLVSAQEKADLRVVVLVLVAIDVDRGEDIGIAEGKIDLPRASGGTEPQGRVVASIRGKGLFRGNRGDDSLSPLAEGVHARDVALIVLPGSEDDGRGKDLRFLRTRARSPASALGRGFGSRKRLLSVRRRRRFAREKRAAAQKESGDDKETARFHKMAPSKAKKRQWNPLAKRKIACPINHPLINPIASRFKTT